MALNNYVTGNRPVKGKELTVEEAKKLFVNFKVSQLKKKTMIALTVILVILAATRKKPFWRFIFWMLAVLSIIL